MADPQEVITPAEPAVDPAPADPTPAEPAPNPADEFKNQLSEMGRKIDNLTTENTGFKAKIQEVTDPSYIRKQAASLLSNDPAPPADPEPDLYTQPEDWKAWNTRQARSAAREETQATLNRDRQTQDASNRRAALNTANNDAEAGFKAYYKDRYDKDITADDLNAFAAFANTHYKGTNASGGFDAKDLEEAWKSYRKDEFDAEIASAAQNELAQNLRIAGTDIPGGPAVDTTSDAGEFAALSLNEQAETLSRHLAVGDKATASALSQSLSRNNRSRLKFFSATGQQPDF